MVNKYYQKHKEIYQNLSEEERDKKYQYAQERRRILSEEEKKRSVNMVVNHIRLL